MKSESFYRPLNLILTDNYFPIFLICRNLVPNSELRICCTTQDEDYQTRNILLANGLAWVFVPIAIAITENYSKGN